MVACVISPGRLWSNGTKATMTGYRCRIAAGENVGVAGARLVAAGENVSVAGARLVPGWRGEFRAPPLRPGAGQALACLRRYSSKAIRLKPAPSSQLSLAIPPPAAVGRRLPSSRNPGARRDSP